MPSDAAGDNTSGRASTSSSTWQWPYAERAISRTYNAACVAPPCKVRPTTRNGCCSAKLDRLHAANRHTGSSERPPTGGKSSIVSVADNFPRGSSKQLRSHSGRARPSRAGQPLVGPAPGAASAGKFT
eukprot:2195432-Heterocapsa_arctica.AAC.1